MNIRLALFALLLATPLTLRAGTWTCESTGAYKECRIGASGTIRLVNELSNRRCFEGLTWGTRSGGIVWVSDSCRALFTADEPAGPNHRIVCESIDGKRHVCGGRTGDGVTLVRQLSKARCDENQTWGFEKRDFIWVDEGCRAEFLLGKPVSLVPPPPVLDAPVTCESDNDKRKQCAADTAGGVQFVKQLGNAPCRFASSWGYDEKGIWVNKGCRAEFVVRTKKTMARSLTCESQNDTRTNCPAETTFGVALVKQLSENVCELDRSWGFDADGVWVSGGCRGQFALGGFRLARASVPATATTIVCESKDGQRTECAIAAARGVGLVEQLGDGPCVLNRTWGYGPDGIWVSEGCRAEFAVAR
jgi:hypothetical protein